MAMTEREKANRALQQAKLADRAKRRAMQASAPPLSPPTANVASRAPRQWTGEIIPRLLKLPADLWAAVDTYKVAHAVRSRTAAIRELIERGLK